jgi:uncharacterized membrane protein YedE/YeeE
MSRGLGNGLIGLLSGLIFGVGLGIAQMTNPEKVIAFLDLAKDWDPSLVFTMAAAVMVSILGYRWILKRGPVLSDRLYLPTRSDVDRRLILGSAIFGIGWGLAGYCPGPAVTALTSGSSEPIVFLAAMLAGSQLERLGLLRRAETMDSKA